jgi:hypothetical protein
MSKAEVSREQQYSFTLTITAEKTISLPDVKWKVLDVNFLFKSKDVPELTYSQVIRNVETLLAT